MKVMKVLITPCLAIFYSASAAPTSSTSDAPICCDKLHSTFPSETFSNTGSQSIKYQAILQSYFVQTSRLHPNCFIQPTSAKQISQVISTLSQEKCKFAIKGGTALLVVGSNNIAGGVTIDLSQLSSTTLSADNAVASVQAGAKWGDVYKYLGPRGYTVNGARATNVGVSGYTLGGGLSLYSSRYGFGCDTVKNYEIVLGNGTLTNANSQQNADLSRALKGGINNLGLVTRFDFHTFESGPLWGGLTSYNFSDIHKFYQPTVDFTNNNARKPDGAYIISWTHNASTGLTEIGTLYGYTGNVTNEKYYTSIDPSNSRKPLPAPFAPFAFDKVGTPTTNSLRVASLYDITYELNGANNTRYILSNILFKCDINILTRVDSIAQNVLRPYMDKKRKAPYIIAQIQYQPFPRGFTDPSIKNGKSRNVLGTDPIKDNSILFLVFIQWADASQDQVVLDISNEILGNVTAYTKSVPGGFRNFQYAGQDNANQDPIGSYGEANVDFLKTVSRKYDPDQVFQKLVPGGFKLGDAGKRYKQFNFNNFVTGGSN